MFSSGRSRNRSRKRSRSRIRIQRRKKKVVSRIGVGVGVGVVNEVVIYNQVKNNNRIRRRSDNLDRIEVGRIKRFPFYLFDSAYESVTQAERKKTGTNHNASSVSGKSPSVFQFHFLNRTVLRVR